MVDIDILGKKMEEATDVILMIVKMKMKEEIIKLM